MTCTSCPHYGKNHTDACIACAKKGYSQHRFNTNELSNKGQTFESYDNHGPMQDDRDVVSEVSKDYIRSRQSSSSAGSPTPVQNMERILGRRITADDIWAMFESWLCEFRALNDMETLLFKAVGLEGQKKVDFGASHGIKSSEVNKLFHSLLRKSPTLQRCLIIKQGSVFETRGRKSVSRTEDGFDGQKMHYTFDESTGKVISHTDSITPAHQHTHQPNTRVSSSIGVQASIFG